jgi:hypothetical protein
MASIGPMRNDHFRAAAAIRMLLAPVSTGIEHRHAFNKGDKSWAREASRGGKPRPRSV